MRNFLIPSLFNNYERFFGHNGNLLGSTDGETSLCDYRIENEENAYHVELDLPGVSDKDIDVSVENDILTIKAERKKEVKDEEGNVTQKTVVSYKRSFTLGEAVDKEKINAISKDGMLILSLPKKIAEKEIKKIAVNKADF